MELYWPQTPPPTPPAYSRRQRRAKARSANIVRGIVKPMRSRTTPHKKSPQHVSLPTNIQRSQPVHKTRPRAPKRGRGVPRATTRGSTRLLFTTGKQTHQRNPRPAKTMPRNAHHVADASNNTPGDVTNDKLNTVSLYMLHYLSITALTDNISADRPPRGHFTLIDPSRLDLLPSPGQIHPNWLTLMPAEVAAAFTYKSHAFLTDPLRVALKSNVPIPKPRIHALTGKYPEILDRLAKAGMVKWSLFHKETAEYSALATKITMTILQ